LQKTRSCFFGGAHFFFSKHYKLTENVTLRPSTSPLGNWTPIGSDHLHAFGGSFDGGGYTIRGLEVLGFGENQGMFGYIRKNAVIENLRLEDVFVSGSNNVGALVGRSSGGTVHNSYASGSINDNDTAGTQVGCLQ